MSKVISGEALSAYERWELPAMELDGDDAEQRPAHDDQTGHDAPRPKGFDAEATLSQIAARVKGINGDQRSDQNPPTLEQLEAIEQQAQEEGFTAGYQEGRKEGKEQGFKKGQQEGFESGYEKGYQEGLAEGQQELLKRLAALDNVLNYMSHPLAELDVDVEQELAHLATAIARRMVRRELQTAEGEIVAVVREAVGLLPVAGRAVIIDLHPKDAAVVRQALKLNDGDGSWQLREDPSLERGGCRVESGASRIDASVEKRLTQAIAAVLGDQRQGDNNARENNRG